MSAPLSNPYDTTRIDLHDAIQALQIGKEIIIPTESVYYKVRRTPLSSEYNNQTSDIVFFSNFESLLDHTESLAPYIPFILASLSPGPLVIKVINKHTHTPFFASVSNHPLLSDLLHILDSPIIGSPNVSSAGLIATDAKMASLFSANMTTLEEGAMLVLDGGVCQIGLEPTLVDCTNHDYATIIRPGAIGYKDLRNVLPPEIQLIEKFRANEQLPLVSRLYESPESNNMLLILGTKEKLKEMFSLRPLEYFQYKQVGNYLLLNLGSQTNIQAVAKNLYRHIMYMQQFGFTTGSIIWQNWGQSSIGLALDYTLHQICKELNIKVENKTLKEITPVEMSVSIHGALTNLQ